MISSWPGQAGARRWRILDRVSQGRQLTIPSDGYEAFLLPRVAGRGRPGGGPKTVPYDFIADLHRVAPCLFTLAETTFDFGEILERCRGWGWTLTEETPDLGVARFLVGGHREAVFDSGKFGGPKGRAYLWIALCYWPDDDSRSGDPRGVRGDAGGERGDFDARFEAACEELRGLLGSPNGQGKYEYRHRVGWPYLYAVWRAERGFLVLQQDELDIQLGLDISIWVLARRGGEALPSFPLSTEGLTGDPSVSTGSADPLWDRDLDG